MRYVSVSAVISLNWLTRSTEMERRTDLTDANVHLSSYSAEPDIFNLDSFDYTWNHSDGIGFIRIHCNKHRRDESWTSSQTTFETESHSRYREFPPRSTITMRQYSS